MFPDTHICGTFIPTCPLPAIYFILFCPYVYFILAYLFLLTSLLHFYIVYIFILFSILHFIFIFYFILHLHAFSIQAPLNKNTVDNRRPSDTPARY